MKTCKMCGEDKELAHFGKCNKTKGGYQHSCKKCLRDRRKLQHELFPERRLKSYEISKSCKIQNRKRYFEYMKDKSCIKCGEANIACLHFDHREPDRKSFMICRGVSDGIGWEKILLEMDKCDILCANCHAKRTAKQRNWYAAYGISYNTTN